MPLKGGRQALPFDPVLVGERFMQQRESLGLSRGELADLCGYGAEQVRRVELGMQTPGARLLAALAEAGGDVRGLLLGASHQEELDEADAIHAARQRDEWRREARLWRQAKADRRKKILSEDEADLIEAYRELDRDGRTRTFEALASIKAGGPKHESKGHHVRADRGSIAAGRDVTIGGKRTKK